MGELNPNNFDLENSVGGSPRTIPEICADSHIIQIGLRGSVKEQEVLIHAVYDRATGRYSYAIYRKKQDSEDTS